MTCDVAWDLILTAEPSDLLGSGDTELSRHLATCERCRSIAAALLAAQGDLIRTLHAPAGTNAVEAARGALRATERRRARTRVVRWVGPLAVAAGLATLVLNRVGPPPAAEPIARRGESESQRVSVTAPPGRSVAVLQTEHSNVVVIWFY